MGPAVKGNPLIVFVILVVVSYVIGEFIIPKYVLLNLFNLIGIIGLIYYSGYIIMFKQLESFNFLSISICIFSFIVLNKTKIHPLFLILTFGLLGYFLDI